MSARPERDATFVGRERELAQLADALDEARLGRGGAVLVLGEAGAGKTALVRALAARSEAVFFAFGACGTERAGEPLEPWLEVLKALRVGSNAADELGALVAELRTPHAQRSPERVDPETASQLALARLTRALQREAEARAIAVVLDDLHLADLTTVRFAAQLADSPFATRLLVIGAQRTLPPDADPVLAQNLARVARANRRIELGPLGGPELAQLAERVAKQPLSRGELEVLQRRCSGNPLLARELLRTTAGADAEQPAPRSFAHLIDARMQALRSADRELIELAAVIGREPSLRWLALAAGVPRADALGALARAEHAGILEADVERAGALAFPHELVRESIYENLPLVRRSILHGAVARALETLHAPGGEPPWLALARHHGESDASDGALRAAACAESAARHALERLAFDDAARHFGAALHWLEFGPPVAPEREAQVLLELGRAHLCAGDPARAERDWQEALRVARDGDAIEPQARAAVELSGLPRASEPEGMRARATVLEDALRRLPAGDSALRAEVGIALARELVGADPARVRATSGEAIALARRLKDPGLLLRAVSSRADLLVYPNDLREREAFAREEIGLARSLLDRGAEAFGHYHLFANALARGDRAAVDEAGEACTSAAAAIGHPLHRGVASSALAARALWQGDLLLAEHHCDEAGRCLADHRARELAFRVATAQRFVLRRFQGRLPELEPQLEAALRDHPERVALSCALALAHAEAGRIEAARAALTRAVERCALDGGQLHLPADADRSWNTALLVETCAWLGDGPTAAALELELEICGDGNACVGGIASLGSVQRYRGLAAYARGECDQALAFLEDALEWEKHTGARPFEAYTAFDCARVALARRAPGDEDLVRDHTARALQIAAGLGMPTLLAAARELAYAR